MRVSEENEGGQGGGDDVSSGGNNLLGALRPADFTLLRPHLRRIDRTAGAVLYEPGDSYNFV